MTFSRLYRFCLWFLAIWFFIGQSFTVAHATSYGDKLHDHDGIMCTVSGLSEDECAPIPEYDHPSFDSVAFEAVYSVSFVSVFETERTARAPPPRAPPL